MKHKIAGLVGFLVLGCVLTGARAANEYLGLGKGSDQPIDITSTKFAARNTPNGKEATFQGNVKVNQGDVTLSCDQLVLVYDEKAGVRYLGTAELRSSPRSWKMSARSSLLPHQVM